MSTTALWISEIFAEMIAEIFAEITCRRAVACLDRVDRLGQIVHASPAGDGVALHRARWQSWDDRWNGEEGRMGRMARDCDGVEAADDTHAYNHHNNSVHVSPALSPEVLRTSGAD